VFDDAQPRIRAERENRLVVQGDAHAPIVVGLDDVVPLHSCAFGGFTHGRRAPCSTRERCVRDFGCNASGRVGALRAQYGSCAEEQCDQRTSGWRSISHNVSMRFCVQ